MEQYSPKKSLLNNSDLEQDIKELDFEILPMFNQRRDSGLGISNERDPLAETLH